MGILEDIDAAYRRGTAPPGLEDDDEQKAPAGKGGPGAEGVAGASGGSSAPDANASADALAPSKSSAVPLPEADPSLSYPSMEEGLALSPEDYQQRVQRADAARQAKYDLDLAQKKRQIHDEFSPPPRPKAPEPSTFEKWIGPEAYSTLRSAARNPESTPGEMAAAMGLATVKAGGHLLSAPGVPTALGALGGPAGIALGATFDAAQLPQLEGSAFSKAVNEAAALPEHAARVAVWKGIVERFPDQFDERTPEGRRNLNLAQAAVGVAGLGALGLAIHTGGEVAGKAIRPVTEPIARAAKAEFTKPDAGVTRPDMPEPPRPDVGDLFRRMSPEQADAIIRSGPVKQAQMGRAYADAKASEPVPGLASTDLEMANPELARPPSGEEIEAKEALDAAQRKAIQDLFKPPGYSDDLDRGPIVPPKRPTFETPIIGGDRPPAPPPAPPAPPKPSAPAAEAPGIALPPGVRLERPKTTLDLAREFDEQMFGMDRKPIEVVETKRPANWTPPPEPPPSPPTPPPERPPSAPSSPPPAPLAPPGLEPSSPRASVPMPEESAPVAPKPSAASLRPAVEVDGQLHVGKRGETHAGIAETLPADLPRGKVRSGWVDESGRFLTDDEAAEIVAASEGRPVDKHMGHSGYVAFKDAAEAQGFDLSGATPRDIHDAGGELQGVREVAPKLSAATLEERIAREQEIQQHPKVDALLKARAAAREKVYREALTQKAASSSVPLPEFAPATGKAEAPEVKGEGASLPEFAASAPKTPDTITRILDAADASKANLVSPVERQGKNGERYWVSETKQGTTVGNRYPSREAWEAAQESYRLNNRADFEKHLRDMTPEQIQSQAEYWLTEKTAPSASKAAPSSRRAKPAIRPETPKVESAPLPEFAPSERKAEPLPEEAVQTAFQRGVVKEEARLGSEVRGLDRTLGGLAETLREKGVNPLPGSTLENEMWSPPWQRSIDTSERAGSRTAEDYAKWFSAELADAIDPAKQSRWDADQLRHPFSGDSSSTPEGRAEFVRRRMEPGGYTRKIIEAAEGRAKGLRRQAEIVEALGGDPKVVEAARKRAGEVDTIAKEARDEGERILADTKAEIEARPTEEAKEVRPLSDLTVKPSAFAGNVAEPGKWITDGTMAIDSESMPKAKADKLAAREHKSSRYQGDHKLEQRVIPSIIPEVGANPHVLEVVGFREGSEHRLAYVAHEGKNTLRTVLDADKVRFIQAQTGFDRIVQPKGSRADSPVVFQKDGKTVAVLMPIHGEHVLDIATARKAVKAPKPANPERGAALVPSLSDIANVPEALRETVARPLLEKAGLSADKYAALRRVDPDVSEGLHLLDNAPRYFRAKADQIIKNVVGGLSQAQERLFSLLADADSREHLQATHPDEYRAAMTDPAIQDALAKYRPIEQEMTAQRAVMGGNVLERDYLRRVYEEHTPGVNKAAVPEPGARAPEPFDRVFGPQRLNRQSRQASADYFYEKGLHEFGPAFGTKYVATNLKFLRDQVGRDFMRNATKIEEGTVEPREIQYRGETYYAPDVARDMGKGAKTFDRYTTSDGEKYLGPREIVNELKKHEVSELLRPGAEPSGFEKARRFFQKQVVGLGFGVPHMLNELRRVVQSAPGGAIDPRGWAAAWKVAFDKELKARAEASLNDPTVDMLAQHGAISAGDMDALNAYRGGNMNPLNWAEIGHRNIFGKGGIDQRARIYIADLVKSQHPEWADHQIAEAVRTQLGDYARVNWTETQKGLAPFMLFPGWDFASARWVLQHPLKTTIPAAMVVWGANRVINALGGNADEDKNDFLNVQVGQRDYSTNLLSEPLAKHVFAPALEYAQSKLRGETGQRAADAASHGVKGAAMGVAGMARPEIQTVIGLATNTERGRDIVPSQDREAPGRVLPSKALEDQAVYGARQAFPIVGRAFDGSDIDLKGFVGGNLGVSNHQDDASRRLFRNEAEALRVSEEVRRLAKVDPAQARAYARDPDNLALMGFREGLQNMARAIHQIDDARQRFANMGDTARVADMDARKAKLLGAAEAVNDRLYKQKQTMRKKVAAASVAPPGF